MRNSYGINGRIFLLNPLINGMPIRCVRTVCGVKNGVIFAAYFVIADFYLPIAKFRCVEDANLIEKKHR
jgi:hypothetical protein